MVNKRNQTIYIFLLVNHVLDKRMDFAIYERIKLECKRVRPSGIRRIILTKHATLQRNPTATPDTAQSPAFFHTVRQILLLATRNDKPTSGFTVVTLIAFTALKRPNLKHPHLITTRAVVEPISTRHRRLPHKTARPIFATYLQRLRPATISKTRHQRINSQIVNLPYHTTVSAKRIIHISEKHHSRTHIRNAAIQLDPLEAATRNKKFLQSTAIKLVTHDISPGRKRLPETTNDALHQLTNHIIGKRLLPFRLNRIIFRSSPRISGDIITPLIPISIILASVALHPQKRNSPPRRFRLCKICPAIGSNTL